MLQNAPKIRLIRFPPVCLLCTYVEQMISELLNSAWYELILFDGTIKVQIEPMGQLNLKTNPYKIGTLFNGNVYYETA